MLFRSEETWWSFPGLPLERVVLLELVQSSPRACLLTPSLWELLQRSSRRYRVLKRRGRIPTILSTICLIVNKHCCCKIEEKLLHNHYFVTPALRELSRLNRSARSEIEYRVSCLGSMELGHYSLQRPKRENTLKPMIIYQQVGLDWLQRSLTSDIGLANLQSGVSSKP